MVSRSDLRPVSRSDGNYGRRRMLLGESWSRYSRLGPGFLALVGIAALVCVARIALAVDDLGHDDHGAFADTVRSLGDGLQKSAAAAHDALQQLASRGAGFTDNDLKDALISLKALEEAYVAAANRVSEAMTGNLRREMLGLATHAQGIGAEASARVAGLVGEFANRMGSAASGLDTMRGAGVRMALLASGVLAGIADALHGRPGSKGDQ